MSFVVYIQFFHERKPAGIPRAAVLSSFSEFISEIGKDQWRLQYDHQTWCEIVLSTITGASNSVHHVSIEKPCQDNRLWEAIIHLMQIGNGVFYFPGSSGLCVLSPSVIIHVPADMLEVLGEPILVKNATDLLRCIETA